MKWIQVSPQWNPSITIEHPWSLERSDGRGVALLLWDGECWHTIMHSQSGLLRRHRFEGMSLDEAKFAVERLSSGAAESRRLQRRVMQIVTTKKG